MPRQIPILLEQHLQQEQTTTCLLLKIVPVTPGFASYGITSLDRDVVYDDGSGQMTYLAAVGMVPAAVQQTADLAVNNTEVPSLLPEFDIPIREQDIRAGVYDFAKFSLMLVNYADLSQGHVTLHSGTVGEVTIQDDGLSFVNELRGLSAKLKQSVCSKDSLSCRAIFGSHPPGSGVPGKIVYRDWCGFNAESLLRDAIVQSVGLETNRTFSVEVDSGWGDDSLNPGVVVWTSGLNAGRTYEIESNTAGGQISLAFETSFPIQAGDELQYREDCSKMARDAEKGCAHWFGNDWVLHFRGEPDIPIGDAGSIETPGASSGPGQGGSTFEPLNDDV